MGQSVRSQPLPLLPVGNRGAVLQTSLPHLEDHLSGPYRALEALAAAHPRGPVRHRFNVVVLGNTQLYVSAHDPIRKRVGEQNRPTLVLPFQGELAIEVAGQRLRAQAGRRALLLSGAPVSGQTGLLSSIRVNLDPRRLEQVALGMTGAHRVDLNFHADRELDLRLPEQVDEIPALSRLLLEIGRVVERPELVPMLGLDDLFDRWVVALLAPATVRQQLVAQTAQAPSRAALDTVCAHVLANLERPIRLSDLEDVSGQSRRALQYAFRRHLDCTPLQWVMQQRLALASKRLSEPALDTSVTAVAQSLGFSHLGEFSRRFAERFGRRPSEVLNAARLRH
jgi:AraC-like DNA-binding protein